MNKLLSVSLCLWVLFIYCSCSKSASGNPHISTISPSSGPDSTKVTITGKGFDAQSGDVVTFNGSGLAIDANNNIYAANFNQEWATGNIVRISPSGVETPLVANENLLFPVGVQLDASGNIYVVQQSIAPSSYYGNIVKMVMH